MDRDKILIVIPDLQLGGGAQRIAAEVGSNLNKRDYEVMFFTVYDEDNTYEYDGQYINLDRPRSSLPLGFSLNILRASRRIAKICKERNIDTVISFMMMGNLGAVLSKVLFRNKAKIILSVHNNPLSSNKVSNLQKRILYPKGDSVVAVSKNIEKILTQKFSIHNTKTIYNLVDMGKINDLAKEDVKSDHKKIFDDGFIFITIGSLRKQKGQWYLIRCFKKITEENENTKLIILGEGNLKNSLKKLVEDENLQDKVHFLGKVDNVFPYLRNSDCFVFPSLSEGFGIVLIEALSQNLPIISTDCISGPREILCPELAINEKIEYPYYGEYGILTKPFKKQMVFKNLKRYPLSEEEKMFGKIMLESIENKKLREKYSTGLERAKYFDVERIIEEWETII